MWFSQLSDAVLVRVELKLNAGQVAMQKILKACSSLSELTRDASFYILYRYKYRCH